MRVIVFVDTENGAREFEVARISPLEPDEMNKTTAAVMSVFKSAVFSPDHGKTYYPQHRVLRVELQDDVAES